MRTTVEIPDELRARLLELAARRGEKGFSRLVEEAIARYLEDSERREKAVREAVGLLGTFSAEEVKALRESVRSLRRRWR